MNVISTIKTGGVNMALRGLSMGGKFALVLYIGRYFGLSELGVYGIVATSVVLGMQLLGLDFYVYNTREILKADNHIQPLFVKDQVIFHCLSYAVVLPLFLSVFLAEILPWEIVGWFYCVVIVEHLSQETTRLLTTLSKPLLASIVVFCRTGLWIVAFIIAGVLDDKFQTIVWLLAFWVAGSVFSLFIGGREILKVQGWDWAHAFSVKPNVKWIKNGIRVAFPFFISTLGLQSIELSDRYFLKAYYGNDIVGIYIFSQNIAGICQVVVVTGLVMIVAPKITEAYLKEKWEKYEENHRFLTIGILVTSAILSAALVILYPWIAKMTNKPEIVQNTYVFYLLLAAMFLYVVGFIPYYSLYVRKRDRSLLVSVVIAAGLNLILNLILIPRYEMIGAAFATLVSIASILMLRFYFVFAHVRAKVSRR
ncbi:MAG: oligosaccharide flippase family protein [Gammaproteobacteria bacterium]|nr:oligosaccharide flippase family protein [Gammaproteobacteria bacterium]